MGFTRLPHGPTALFVLVASFSTAAAAQEQNTSAEAVGMDIQGRTDVQPTPEPAARATERRPAALAPLYASFITLQVLDLRSTHDAISRGGVETNPALAGMANNMVAMSAVKAAGAAGVIFVSEKLRTRNKAAAIGLMIAANSAMAWVVQHNYRLTLH
jgi:hypothetical protein